MIRRYAWRKVSGARPSRTGLLDGECDENDIQGMLDFDVCGETQIGWKYGGELSRLDGSIPGHGFVMCIHVAHGTAELPVDNAPAPPVMKSWTKPMKNSFMGEPFLSLLCSRSMIPSSNNNPMARHMNETMEDYLFTHNRVPAALIGYESLLFLCVSDQYTHMMLFFVFCFLFFVGVVRIFVPCIEKFRHT